MNMGVAIGIWRASHNSHRRRVEASKIQLKGPGAIREERVWELDDEKRRWGLVPGDLLQCLVVLRNLTKFFHFAYLLDNGQRDQCLSAYFLIIEAPGTGSLLRATGWVGRV